MAFYWYLTFAFVMYTFPKQYFLCQFPLNSFDYNNILISIKKNAEYISVNIVRATLLLHKLMVLHT